VLIHDWLFSEGEPADVCLWGLAHDWSEAYLVDLAAPIKHHTDGFGDRFLSVEAEIERAIAKRFDLELPIPSQVKAIDLQIRETEMAELLPPVEREDWGEGLPITIPEWGPVEGKMQMIWRMETYGIVERDSKGNYRATKEYVMA
jgi:hypothetical protein